MATRFSNIRQVIRDLGCHPMFTATVILTLAIGIGATTAAFALIDAVFLTRLPVHDQGRVVGMWANSPTGAFGGQWPVPWGIQTRLADRGRAFSGVAAYRSGEPYGFAARTGDRTVHVAVTAVSGNFFDVDYIDVGVFGAPEKGNALGKLLAVRKVHVTQRTMSADVVVPERPSKAGIDPFNKLIDRTPEDNVRTVEVKP